MSKWEKWIRVSCFLYPPLEIVAVHRMNGSKSFGPERKATYGLQADPIRCNPLWYSYVASTKLCDAASYWVPPLSHLSSLRSRRTGRWPTHHRTACTSCTSRSPPWVKTARLSWSTTARPTQASAGAASRLLTRPPPTSCTGYRRASRRADTSICLFLLLLSWNRLDRSCDTLNIFKLR
jgi:hypothetical protein